MEPFHWINCVLALTASYAVTAAATQRYTLICMGAYHTRPSTQTEIIIVGLSLLLYKKVKHTYKIGQS